MILCDKQSQILKKLICPTNNFRVQYIGQNVGSNPEKMLYIALQNIIIMINDFFPITDACSREKNHVHLYMTSDTCGLFRNKQVWMILQRGRQTKSSVPSQPGIVTPQ
ncbi:hypothetical protein KUTeg_000289 [Tegillarca granosa]|uniref:Uncharacterized protein n=1 Tax=Tegillarca granosa TaxID=220873 RepID=A0ABQ9FX36_TEGGR|nr:hypothetical protein KUTeg_000289 [Tegillarca granosa]